MRYMKRRCTIIRIRAACKSRKRSRYLASIPKLIIIFSFCCSVDHVEPWLSGNARGPSSAFCLIYRLGELKPSPPEIREMIDHHDSPYIRAVSWNIYLKYLNIALSTLVAVSPERIYLFPLFCRLDFSISDFAATHVTCGLGLKSICVMTR